MGMLKLGLVEHDQHIATGIVAQVSVVVLFCQLDHQVRIMLNTGDRGNPVSLSVSRKRLEELTKSSDL